MAVSRAWREQAITLRPSVQVHPRVVAWKLIRCLGCVMAYFATGGCLSSTKQSRPLSIWLQPGLHYFWVSARQSSICFGLDLDLACCISYEWLSPSRRCDSLLLILYYCTGICVIIHMFVRVGRFRDLNYLHHQRCSFRECVQHA